MSGSNILYVCQEITPYMPETDISVQCRVLSQAMQEKGNEIRTFMPRYGCINERRNQLHEVIRLSGMNLIIDNNDHQLIIKVASIPSARVQIYFIDNDDYFSRKYSLQDAQGEYFIDNDERAIFFARGVLETVKKLRWKPDVVHCHGWFSCVTPMYLKHAFVDDPLFHDVKVVVSLYGDGFPGELNTDLKSKVKNEGVPAGILSAIERPSMENLSKFIIEHTDGIIIETDRVSQGVLEAIQKSGIPTLQLQDKTTPQYLDNYQKFYEELLT